MLRIISRNGILFAGYMLFVFSLLILLFLLGKKETHLFLTGFHNPFLDEVMKLITWLGDGAFMVITGIILLFIRIRYGLIILGSFITSSLLVQFLKRIVFADCKRPVAWFHDIGIEIYRIGGIEYHSAFSFPSGHSTTAFALFFGLAFFVNRKWLKLLFLLLAVITGFSRVYLSQHFLGDMLAGSLIGVIIALFMQSLFQKIHSGWMDKSINSLIWKKNA